MSVHGATGYEIHRSLTVDLADASLLDTVSEPDNSYEDTSVEPGLAYTYWVRAINPISASPYSTGVGGLASGCDFYVVPAASTGISVICP